MRQWFHEVWNERNEATIDRLMVPDTLVHGLGGDVLRGPAAFKPFWHAFQGAFSDLHIEILSTTAEGEFVVAHCRVTGRHTGPGLGFAATGQPIDITGFTRGRIVDGRLVEGWNAFDFLTMYQQLGKLPNPVL
jgi:predicted ester cyclase